MATERRHRRENTSTRRLEAYTDGVFAIAATLLVLDLSITGFRAVGSNAELWDALTGIGGNFFSFLISFLLLCLLWSVHTRQFEHVQHADGVVVALNSLRLLGVVLIPFTTTINSTYDALWLGKILLPINFFFVILMGSVQWFYMARPNTGLVAGLSSERLRETQVVNVNVVVIAALVVAAAPFVGSWSFALFALNSPADRVATQLLAKRAMKVNEEGEHAA